jgi:hypothetical protein
MASGDSLIVFQPLADRPPASNYATLDLRGGFAVLDFDDATNESAVFQTIVPAHYLGGNLVVNLMATTTSATSGNAMLRLELTRLAAGANLDSPPSVGGSDDVTLAAPTTAGDLVAAQTDAISIGGLAAGDCLEIVVTRRAADAGDTLSGDVELVALELREV